MLIETVAQRQVVAHACEQSRRLGIQPGMAVSVARAAITSTNLAVEPHDPHRTRRVLRALALWCHRFSPVVAEEDSEGICLDVTGCAHLFGGEQQMVIMVVAAFHRLGFKAQIAIAPTYAAARAISRNGTPSTIVKHGGIHEAVGSLPIRSLIVKEDALASLAEVNIRSVSNLLALPRPAIAARFGDELLGAVDRLLGRSPELIQPLRPVEPARVEQLFDGPCGSLEAIGLACQGLLQQLCVVLASRNEGVVEWYITLERSDLDPLPIALRHCAPSRDAQHLWRLLEPRLERAQLGFGVEGVTIAAVRTKRINHHQQSWWGESAPGEQQSSPADVLIDTLVNRLGKDAVLKSELLQSHIPERAFVLHSVLDSSATTADLEPCQGDRPTQLFPTPIMVRVIVLNPDGPVSQLEWSGITHRIITCIGPERIKGEWWQRERLLRDYYKVQDESGRWLWLFRDHLQGQWFLHGIWA